MFQQTSRRPVLDTGLGFSSGHMFPATALKAKPRIKCGATVLSVNQMRQVFGRSKGEMCFPIAAINSNLV
jgi:hypothetical protein